MTYFCCTPFDLALTPDATNNEILISKIRVVGISKLAKNL